MATAAWLKRVNGLNNKVDPARFQYDKQHGVPFLSEAYNVDIGLTGDVSRRKGYTATNITDSCHSIFFGGFELLSVLPGALSIIGSDYTSTPIRNIDSTKRMSYAQLGQVTYYMNGVQKGFVRDGASWEYVLPSNLRYNDSTRAYSDPPVGSIIRYFAGRMYIAEGNTLWYSEPFAPNIFRLATNYIRFQNNIKMVAPVLTGIFVSTESKIYFLAGTDPKQFQQLTVTNYPAIEGTDVEADGIVVESGKYSAQPLQIFTTPKGICIGTVDGKVTNLTFDTLEYPFFNSGTAVYTGRKYIVNLYNTAGTGITLAVSLLSSGVTQYGSYNFASMFNYAGTLLGGNSSGLYLLESGNTDDGSNIGAFFRTGPTDFGAEEEKRLRRTYVNYRTNGRLKLSVSGDGKDDIISELVPSNSDLRMFHQRAAGGRDIRGKYLDLKVENIGGADFTVNGVTAVLLVLGAKTQEGA